MDRLGNKARPHHTECGVSASFIEQEDPTCMVMHVALDYAIKSPGSGCPCAVPTPAAHTGTRELPSRRGALGAPAHMPACMHRRARENETPVCAVALIPAPIRIFMEC